MLTMDSIRKTGATTVTDIVLAPLFLHDVSQVVADSLHQEATRTEPLARLVYEKTAGNPFFAIQFLTALAEEHLVEFDSRKAAWRWDMDRIRARGITDNVVDLLIGKLNRLPDNTREALKQLACLGNRANTTTLVVVHGRSEEETLSDLTEAVREGFVVLSDGSYEFVHDRVHEAAYSLIRVEDRAKVHLRIGRLLIAAMPADKIAERIFNLVDQFNRGAALISDPIEKQRVFGCSQLHSQIFEEVSFSRSSPTDSGQMGVFRVGDERIPKTEDSLAERGGFELSGDLLAVSKPSKHVS